LKFSNPPFDQATALATLGQHYAEQRSNFPTRSPLSHGRVGTSSRIVARSTKASKVNAHLDSNVGLSASTAEQYSSSAEKKIYHSHAAQRASLSVAERHIGSYKGMSSDSDCGFTSTTSKPSISETYSSRRRSLAHFMDPSLSAIQQRKKPLPRSGLKRKADELEMFDATSSESGGERGKPVQHDIGAAPCSTFSAKGSNSMSKRE
jgi:hypothetical protein